MNVAIIGGGASGLFASIIAAKSGHNVTVYERLDRVGKKILATGNGRCNISNAGARKNDYHGTCARLVDNVSNEFWVSETMSFFEQLGLIIKCTDDGKMYPYSDQATSVLDVLRFEMDNCGVSVCCKFDVKSIKKKKDVFEIISYDGRGALADKVVLACGGKASPALGSNGSGYVLAQMLGHTVTELRPAIVQLKTNENLVKSLKGIKVQASISYNSIEKQGEILFTEYGISGPPVFSLSSYFEHNKTAYIDFLPEYSIDNIYDMLYVNKDRNPNLENLFVGVLNKRVGMQIIKSCGFKFSQSSSSLTKQDLLSIASAAKKYALPITDTQSWNNAQVTAGGVPLSEIDERTLESKKTRGVYIIGELLDIDGDCGGYNLQWAWSSGYISGKSV